MSSIRSFPKVYTLDHKAIKELFNGQIVGQEKIDGSQFSAGVSNNKLLFRSKGAVIHDYETAPDLFKPAVKTFTELFEAGKLHEDWIYRGESVCRPKHNTITYNRIPTGGFILFDVDIGIETRISDPNELKAIADDLGLECVPTIFIGEIKDLEEVKKLLDTESVLGGAQIEGIVFKNYNRFGIDGKQLMGKLVRDSFKEEHRKNWNKGGEKGTKREIIDRVISRFGTENRYLKSVQHREENGELDNSPKDIGPLIAMVQQDVLEECEDDIKDMLFNEFWPHIKRGIVRELPYWYKARLSNSQFDISDG